MSNKKTFLSLAFFSILIFPFSNLHSQEQSFLPQPEVYKIWDHAEHNAFTDLVRFKGHFYCIFREGSSHVPGSKDENGKIRILKSRNGKKWKSVASLKSEMYDLRDPKISVTPDKGLMVLMGGSDYVGRTLRSRLCQVSFSRNGKDYSDLTPVKIDEKIKTNSDWLWKVTWKGNTAYGIVYQPDTGKEWGTALVASADGINYKLVSQLHIDGKPNESTIRFSGDTLYTILRREAGVNGVMGISSPPYADFEWIDLGLRLGGPEFQFDRDGKIMCGTRTYPGPGERSGYKTEIIIFNKSGKELQRIPLPSGGDTSYPGMVLKGKKLWMSYYSSHEGKSSIYITCIKF